MTSNQALPSSPPLTTFATPAGMRVPSLAGITIPSIKEEPTDFSSAPASYPSRCPPDMKPSFLHVNTHSTPFCPPSVPHRPHRHSVSCVTGPAVNILNANDVPRLPSERLASHGFGASICGPYISRRVPPSTESPASSQLFTPSPLTPSTPATSFLALADDPADADADPENAWNLVPYHIPWGSSYVGYRSGTLPGPDGDCIFLRSPTPLKNQRTGQACEKCRERKAKCSGTRPSCTRCLTRGHVCHYGPENKNNRNSISSDGSDLSSSARKDSTHSVAESSPPSSPIDSISECSPSDSPLSQSTLDTPPPLQRPSAPDQASYHPSQPIFRDISDSPIYDPLPESTFHSLLPWDSRSDFLSLAKDESLGADISMDLDLLRYPGAEVESTANGVPVAPGEAPLSIPRSSSELPQFSESSVMSGVEPQYGANFCGQESSQSDIHTPTAMSTPFTHAILRNTISMPQLSQRQSHDGNSNSPRSHLPHPISIPQSVDAFSSGPSSNDDSDLDFGFPYIQDFSGHISTHQHLPPMNIGPLGGFSADIQPWSAPAMDPPYYDVGRAACESEPYIYAPTDNPTAYSVENHSQTRDHHCHAKSDSGFKPLSASSTWETQDSLLQGFSEMHSFACY